MNRTIIIKTDGSRVEKEWSDGLRPSLDELQAAVGGYIEAVPHVEQYKDQPAVMYCNEEGKLSGLPYNYAATALWYEAMEQVVADALVGDCIIVTGSKDFVNG